MRTVGEFLEGGYLLTEIDESESVLAASWRMIAGNIGALLVLRDGRPVGIITERDLLVRVIGLRRDPAEAKVGEVMHAPFTHVGPDTTLEECERLMAAQDVRHLPVLDGDVPVGMISMRDLLHAETSKQRGHLPLEQSSYQLH